MRLIDADEAVKGIQKKAKKLQNDVKLIEAKKCKDKYDKQRNQQLIEKKQYEIACMADFISFLVFDCKEIKVNTKEKE